MSKRKKNSYEVADRSGNLQFAIDKFGLVPDVTLKKKEKKILKAIAEYEDADFYFLCNYFDVRPSKLGLYLCDLEMQGLIHIDDNTLEFNISEAGKRFCGRTRKLTGAEKKFRKFLESLTDEELRDFCDMCDQIIPGGTKTNSYTRVDRELGKTNTPEKAKKKDTSEPEKKKEKEEKKKEKEIDFDDDDFSYLSKPVRLSMDDEDDLFLDDSDITPKPNLFGDGDEKVARKSIMKHKKMLMKKSL